MNEFFDWAFQLWPAWALWVIVPWAFLAIGMGALLFIVIRVLAIRHYGFGKPSYVWKNGAPATPSQALTSFLMGGGVGAFFTVIGVLLLRWQLG